MGMDRFLQPCQVIWFTQLRKLVCTVHIPSLVAVNCYTDFVSHCLTDLFDSAKIPLHIGTVITSHFKFNSGVAFLHIPDHVFYQLIILHKKGTAAFISLGPVFCSSHKSVKRLFRPLSQNIQHHQIQLSYLHCLFALKSGVSYLPVKTVSPLIVAMLFSV